MPPMMMRYLMPQKPFWIPALGSEDDLTLIMMTAMRVKNRVTIRYSLDSGHKIYTRS